MRFIRRPVHLLLACLLLAGSACATSVSREVALAKWTPQEERRAEEQIEGDRSPELLVLLAFSGGGTRAAALSYGVLQELAATEVSTEKGPRPLHHEVDMISSVSGGSFTSAYFGLRGDGIFEDFEERFLRKNIEGALIGQLFNPLNWFKMMARSYGRSDLAAEYYGKHLFDDATFADLARPNAPAVLINATDLGAGVRVPFYREFFDLICADIDQYPVSRAVAASSAVPGLFSPINLKNHAGTCGYETQEWLLRSSKEERASVHKADARALMNFLDREKRPWLHLVDGGIADNLGLRSFWTRVSMAGGLDRAFPEVMRTGAPQILLILVNAIKQETPGWVRLGNVPSLPQVLGSVTSIQIARYDLDTIELVRESFEKWSKESSTPERPVSFDFVEVSFERVRDAAQREALNEVSTSFAISDEQVDDLISVGRQVLRESPEFQSFLERNRNRRARP
jgi:NTE family protein